MTPQELEQKLYAPSEHEMLYLQGVKSIHEATLMKTVLLNGVPVQVADLSRLPQVLLGGGKHARFGRYPIHIHPWIELIYMYSGQCTQQVNGRPVTLCAGQALILDQNTMHALPVLGEKDIMLNIYIRKEYLTAAFFNRISQKNLISQFFINAITDGLAHDSYMVFRSETSRRLRLYIQEYFCELYDPSSCSEDILSSLFTLILTELIQVCQNDAAPDTSVLPILRYIEQNYRSITLTEAAAHFSLNPNYLSNLLKARTGASFRTLVSRQRMIAARQLLLNSDLPIAEVARQVGYENTTFFYKKFEAETGCSPSALRKGRLP